MPSKKFQAPVEPGTALTKPAGGAVADWRAILAGMQAKRTERAAEVATGTSPKLTFGPSGASYNKGEAVPSLPVLILAAHFYREYYDRPYDEHNPTGPRCYSFDGKMPHPQVHERQDVIKEDKSVGIKARKDVGCNDCPKNAFGSNANDRGGKACAEVARMAVIHVDDLKRDLTKVEPAVARVSVMNRKELAKHEAKNYPTTTVVKLEVKSMPGSVVGYDLKLTGGPEAQLNDVAGMALTTLSQLAEKKFEEPMPAYKVQDKSTKMRKFATK